MIKSAQGNGLLQGNPDPIMLHPFRCQKALGEMHIRKAPAWLFSPIQQLGKLSRAMGYLVSAEFSIDHPLYPHDDTQPTD